MSALLEIRQVSNNAVIGDLIDLGTAIGGGILPIPQTYYIRNIGDSAAEQVRVAARCRNGLYVNQEGFVGGEAIENKWLEVSVDSGAWTPIGGDFSIDLADIGNYITLPDIAVGADSAPLQFRLNVPETATSTGRIQFQGILVSCAE